MNDYIVEEIRKARYEHAARFGFDLHAICEDLRKQEKEGGRPVVHFPPKKLVKKTGS